MTLKGLRYVFCLVSICLLPLIGCADSGKPNLPSTKPSPAQDKKITASAYLSKLAVVGCDVPKKFKDVPGPLKGYREKMKSYYGFFLDSKDHKGESKILDQCSSIDAIDRFFTVFWSVRDPDISTPENENRQLVDGRIKDIENEVLFTDLEMPGIRFVNNGGLTGDLAHVYLFRGNAHYKVKTFRTNRLANLMAWVYFDENQRPLYVFLFYDKGFGYHLFRNYSDINTVESLMMVLRELSKVSPTSDSDYEQLYQELVENDTEYIFRFAISRFSYYPDIKVDKVLAPPTPEAMTAKAIQPKILGVPDVPEGVKMIMSAYFSKITGYSSLTRDSSGEYNLTLSISIAGIDWKEVDDKLQSTFHLSISVTNEKTREAKYFTTGLGLNMPADQYSKNYFLIDLKNISNRERGLEGKTIADLFKTLAPGDYEVKIFLINQITPNFSLKSGIWYEYVTISK